MSGAPLLLLMTGDPTPALDLNFLGGMPGGLTYTNSSTERVYWDSTGTRRSAVANEPIFETLNGVAQGMRWEMEARTNLAANSEGAAATWTVSNVSDAGTPIAGFSASLAVGDNSVARTAYKIITLSTATIYTVSIFVQMDDGNAPVIGTSTSSGDFVIISDATLHSASATVQRITGAIYRVSSARTATVGGSRTCGIAKYTGQSARTFRIIGIQVEAAASASSYIPTAGSAVIRQPDVLTATSISPWYRQDEGTVVFEGIASAITAANQGLFFFNNGSTFERILARYSTAGNPTLLVINGGVAQCVVSTAVAPAGSVFRHAASYKVSNFNAATNGTLGTPDTSGAVATGINALAFGYEHTATAPFMGYARRFQYYRNAFPASQIQGLSRV